MASKHPQENEINIHNFNDPRSTLQGIRKCDLQWKPWKSVKVKSSSSDDHKWLIGCYQAILEKYIYPSLRQCYCFWTTVRFIGACDEINNAVFWCRNRWNSARQRSWFGQSYVQRILLSTPHCWPYKRRKIYRPSCNGFLSELQRGILRINNFQ